MAKEQSIKLMRGPRGWRLNLRGHRFGRLVAVMFVGTRKSRVHWLCECDCGRLKIISANMLVRGDTVSCGCARAERAVRVGLAGRIHGMYGTPTYGVWRSMLSRCYQKTNHGFRRYGAKGIRVCNRWHRFEYFLEDMGKRPVGLTLDRFPDGRGNYEPGNCRWATWNQQARNRSNNHLLTFNGRTQCITDWSREFNINVQNINHRLRAGWTITEALTTPVKSPCGVQLPSSVTPSIADALFT